MMTIQRPSTALEGGVEYSRIRPNSLVKDVMFGKIRKWASILFEMFVVVVLFYHISGIWSIDKTRGWQPHVARGDQPCLIVL